MRSIRSWRREGRPSPREAGFGDERYRAGDPSRGRAFERVRGDGDVALGGEGVAQVDLSSTEAEELVDENHGGVRVRARIEPGGRGDVRADAVGDGVVGERGDARAVAVEGGVDGDRADKRGGRTGDDLGEDGQGEGCASAAARASSATSLEDGSGGRDALGARNNASLRGRRDGRPADQGANA